MAANANFDNNKRFSLWENSKPQSDKSPHFTGQLEINGVEYWVSMWEDKQARGNKPVFSGSVKEKEERRESRRDDRRDDDQPRGRAQFRTGGGRDY